MDGPKTASQNEMFSNVARSKHILSISHFKKAVSPIFEKLNFVFDNFDCVKIVLNIVQLRNVEASKEQSIK